MITIDLEKLIPPELLAYPNVIAAVIPDIAEAIRTEIARLAGERLRSTSEDYTQGLQPVKYNLSGGKLPAGESRVASIALVGWLPNAVEHGWPGGDMKPALLRGRNSRSTKTGGRYNVVSFRHGTPGTTGRNAPPMGSAYAFGARMVPGGVQDTGHMSKAAAEKLGKQIHKAAKQLAATTGAPGAKTQWGGKLLAGMAPKLEPHHKTDIYAGMVRQEKVYKKATQSQYSTFRAVSSKSDSRSWIHPGIEGHRLFDAGATYAGKAAEHLLQQALAAVQRGKGL